MIVKSLRKRIYDTALNILETHSLTRSELIEEVLVTFNFSDEELNDSSVNSSKNECRSYIGTLLTEMLECGVIEKADSERYRLSAEKSEVVRIEACEREIIRILTRTSADRSEIRRALAIFFATDKTPTKRDDGRLNDFISKTLKRLTDTSVITYDGKKYSLSEKTMAKADDINALMMLKSEFLSKLHSKGGEFFEHYFMNLLSRYLTKQKKTVTECTVSGGTTDGGIDGVLKTVDSLGFRETVMVQTKNRNAIISETDVRGFYGALCAYRGTRGIFATTSVFHSGAKAFIDSIDECVGVDADMLFTMALECLYGIRRKNRKLTLDEKII